MDEYTDISANQFTDDLWKIINRHRQESIITYAAMIGVLEIIQMDLADEMRGDEDEDDD